MTFIADNLERIRGRIAGAARKVGRRTQEITLVAISKTHPADRIREAYELGVRHFGENRIQEWESKKNLLADLNATWHMVGHLQSNKAARAVRLFQRIDSVDGSSLVQRLDREQNNQQLEGGDPGGSRASAAMDRMPVLIEVKLDAKSAKSGVSCEDLESLAKQIMDLSHLELMGIMTVPPYFHEPEYARSYFRRLRELRDSLRGQFGAESFPVLSMGMSHDFEIAIEEGATEIRVGTALFGERPRA
jgi:pyridoxal phosphate enzyme (YggS family)